MGDLYSFKTKKKISTEELERDIRFAQNLLDRVMRINELMLGMRQMHEVAERKRREKKDETRED